MMSKHALSHPGLVTLTMLVLMPLLCLAPAPGAAEEPTSVEEEAVETADGPESSTTLEETLTVVGIRASDDAPVTKTNLDREQIDKLSYGQDTPQLLQYTPSMNWYSDSGIGTNYSYFNLRGIGQTRINMTFDGAPLNDPAEHAVYFNNFSDFANSVDSIQIQRGVGTSSVGAPSYGGSVNFASGLASPARGGDLRLVLGSYDTKRASVAYESGILDNGLSVSGRISVAETDGYRDNSGTEDRTIFLNAGWQGAKSSLKFVSFFGHEESQLAWLAVDPETLRENRRFNPLDPAETDNFNQNFAQLKYSRALGSETLLTASLYYNGADGWFRLWDDPVEQNALLQFGIDQGFVGTMVTVSKTTERFSGTLGFHYNDFFGDHTLDTEGVRLYANTGFKKTANAFGKIEYNLGSWLLFGDLQLRWADFSYDGDVDLGSVSWSFVDPRVGVRRFLSPNASVYASLGRAQREPARTDLLLGEDNATVPHDLEAVVPEKVVDLEAGFDFNTPHLALMVNMYAMEFTDEIALTGELSDIGLPLRRNVDDSYRRGLEIDLKWLMSDNWSLIHSANLSRNRISEWTQFYDVYDPTGAWIGSEPITYENVKPLLSPEAILNLGFEWAHGGTTIGAMGRYVAEAQLDNTGLAEFTTPAFTNLDLRASVSLGQFSSGGFWAAANPRITLFVNNLFDRDDQYPSGYSYQFINQDATGRQTLDGTPYYYPMATRNVVLSLAFDL